MADIDPDSLNDVIHGRLRLGVMAYLSGVESSTFNTLKEQLKATGGNLSVALSKLAAAGYIATQRTIEDRRTLTTVWMTEAGRTAWLDYLDQMKRLLNLDR
jgi:DNA-binding MarR family transcriptional regulator